MLADGFRLLPRLVAPPDAAGGRGLAAAHAGLPAAGFEQRGSLWSIAGRTSDPGRALANLLERDSLFTDRLSAETQALDLPTIVVDGSQDEDSLVDHVARLFGLEARPRRVA